MAGSGPELPHLSNISDRCIEAVRHVGYSRHKKTILRTDEFANWAKSLRDARAKAAIAVRIERMAAGNAGDVAPVGEGVSEARIHHGPGYRLNFVERAGTIIILL